MGLGKHQSLTFWYFSDEFEPLEGSPSFPTDSFSTSARGLEPPFLGAEGFFAFLGGVCDRAESKSSSDPWPASDMASSSSSSLAGLARFLVAAGLAESVVWVNFLGAAFLGAALALGFCDGPTS